MKALFKHELRAYFYSPVTYIFIGLFFMICALYFFIDNIKGRSADFSSFYGTFPVVMLFMLPVLTAGSIADDRKSGMEILLITSPSSVPGIIFGKFLALMCVFAAMLLPTLILPCFMLLFANVSTGLLICRYTGLLLLGASIISFGIFASSLTENQVSAAIVSLLVLLLMFISKPIGRAAGGTLAGILNGFSVFSRFSDINSGRLDIEALVYYLGFCFAFLFFTVQATNFRRYGGGK
ncbi:MAG: ABC transporter permease [Firmicutes bacterium]|nr:ABC transporter permease [Bacillota bacterium]